MPQLAGTLLVGSFVRPVANGIGLRLHGSSSGAVGLLPAANAGSTDYTLPSADGSSGQALSTNGSGQLAWSSYIAWAGTPNNGQLLIGNGTGYALATLTAGDNITISNGPGTITIAASGGNAEPGGDDGQLQFNDSGVFAGSDELSWDATNHQLNVNHRISSEHTELVLEQLGDTFGRTRFYLRNRLGFNGVMIENPDLDLADILLKCSSTVHGLLRYEHRNGVTVHESNQTAGEFQFWPNGIRCVFGVGANFIAIEAQTRLSDGANLTVGTTNGTKIADAADQKLGFYGATPVVQRAKANYNNWANVSDVVQALVDLGLFDQV